MPLSNFSVLSFEKNAHRTSHKLYFPPIVEIKDYNVMIEVKIFFDKPVKKNLKILDSIREIATDHGDDYTTGCLLDYLYFKEHYEMIVIDLSKQQALNADPRTIQRINFTGNLNRDGYTTTFFFLEEAKDTILDFSQGTVRVL